MIIICWDYDGTLVSSELIYKNIFIKYLKNSGYVLKDINDDCYFSKYAGKHPFSVLEHLKEDGYINKNTTINLEELNNIFQKELNDSNELLLTDNIINILTNLKQNKNVTMAIVTSTYRNDFKTKFYNSSVKELNNFFDIKDNIYICEEVGTKQQKPDPNGYIFAYNDIVKKFGLQHKDNCLITVEDSISGCMSGANAKNKLKDIVDCKVIGYTVSNKYISNSDLINSGADYVAKKPNELLRILNSIISKYKKD